MARKRIKDPRYLPAYGITEAAHYLGLPASTLASWARGMQQGKKKRPMKPILVLPDKSQSTLSFVNLVEAHVLSALRREHNIPLQTVRKALDFLEKRYPTRDHPLADNRFATDGVDLFVEEFGQLMQLTPPGQMMMKEAVRAHLARIDRDPKGAPIKLYPFTRWTSDIKEPKAVEIDPRISFGRPVLIGTGIPTAVVMDRYKAGESIASLSEDYNRTQAEIEEAIRCEARRAAA